MKLGEELEAGRADQCPGRRVLRAMKRPHWLIVAGAFALVPTSERHVDGKQAGAFVSGPEETQVSEDAPEFEHFQIVTVSSTNFVIGMDAPTGR